MICFSTRHNSGSNHRLTSKPQGVKFSSYQTHENNEIAGVYQSLFPISYQRVASLEFDCARILLPCGRMDRIDRTSSHRRRSPSTMNGTNGGIHRRRSHTAAGRKHGHVYRTSLWSNVTNDMVRANRLQRGEFFDWLNR